MKKNREVICAFAAWVLSACFFMSCFMIPGLAEKINSLGNSNMLVYGMSLILFCLLFASGMGIAHRHEVAGKTFPENVKARKTVFWLMLFIQIPFWLLCISGETEQLGSVAAKYGWHTQPAVIAAFLFLAELAIFFWACQNVCFPEKDGEWIIRLVYAALVLLVFYSMYTPNIFGRGELSDAYHGHAYFNSVYNIYQGMPYTHNVTSIYGHYGLFFKIPMELVHGDFKAFVAMVAGIGAFAHICAFLILELLVKSLVEHGYRLFRIGFQTSGVRRIKTGILKFHIFFQKRGGCILIIIDKSSRHGDPVRIFFQIRQHIGRSLIEFPGFFPDFLILDLFHRSADTVKILLCFFQPFLQISGVRPHIQGNLSLDLFRFRDERKPQEQSPRQKDSHDKIPADPKKQSQKQGSGGQSAKNTPHNFPFLHQLYPFTLLKAPIRSSRPSKTLAFVSSASSSSWLSWASPNIMENTGTSICSRR